MCSAIFATWRSAECGEDSAPAKAFEHGLSDEDLCFACAVGELAGAVKNLVMNNTHHHAEPLSEKLWVIFPRKSVEGLFC
jgi:hypothetical protein